MSGSLSTIFPSEECVICLDLPSTHIFVPCNHAVTCQDCSSQVVNAKLLCPICRHLIEECQLVDKTKYEFTHDVSRLELDKFIKKSRDQYLKRLKSTTASNAGCVGNSKFAKAVKREFADAFEQVVLERDGTERCTAKKVDHQYDEDSDTLITTFLVGRRTRSEVFEYIESPKEIIESFTEPMTVLDLATDYPQQYWALHYHTKGKVEDTLRENDLLQVKRRRRGRK